MNKRIRSIIGAVGMLTFLVAVLLKSSYYFEKVNRAQSKELLEHSVRKAAIECYAVEGIYPYKLEYLEEQYGVSYDKEKYGVEYGCWSSNVMPVIVVYEK